jgi:hypothetical protein
MIKTPSKHISLELLLEIQTNNYIGRSGLEYCDDEVDSLIYAKQSSNDIREVEQMLNRFIEAV